MKKKLLTLLFSLGTMILTAQGFQMPAGPGEGSYSRSWRDVNYASDGMESHNMDIYLPKEQKNKCQAIIVIYGSAWFSNNAKAMASASIGTPLLNAGYAVISINHRSSTEAIWPAQIQDVKAAIRYVRANAARYDIDPSFIGITGFSSGGHLATFAGVTNGVKTLTAGDVTVDIEGTVGDYLSAGSHVDAVVDWFGPVDMARMSNCEAPNDASSPEAVLIGKKDPRHEPDWVKLISPINFVDEDDPKILIIHGDADNVVPHCQSLYLKTAYDRAGVEAIFISVPDGGHGPGCFDAQYFQKMTDFFTIQSSN
ncbi:MAG: alpha/beta hydrolase [Bacteroidales bacterium]|jgi:acetyl esterase/lipase|nr:alpha/beta hydrolase [Synergistaceae bacterium]MDD4500195.1 alpha/beta hydrolase [Bacteroidales bacterium]